MKKRIFNPLTGEFDYVGEITGDYVVNYAGDYVVKYDGDYVAMKYDGDYIEQCVGIKINLIDNSNAPSLSLTMQADNRYLFSSPVGLLVVSFDRFTSESSHVYELDFVAGDNVSVKIPDSVKWVKTPVFNPGKRYLISIDAASAAGETILTAMYLEMEA